MMVFTHIVIGGTIGQIVEEPVSAFSLGVVSHLISDKIPHFWPKGKHAGRFFTWLDICSSLILMAFLWLIGFHSVGFWAGVVGSVSVDCLAMAAKFTGYMKFYDWQHLRQPHLSNKLILSTDATIIILGLITILSFK